VKITIKTDYVLAIFAERAQKQNPLRNSGLKRVVAQVFRTGFWQAMGVRLS
jgi:hypothetical protein